MIIILLKAQLFFFYQIAWHSCLLDWGIERKHAEQGPTTTIIWTEGKWCRLFVTAFASVYKSHFLWCMLALRYNSSQIEMFTCLYFVLDWGSQERLAECRSPAATCSATGIAFCSQIHQLCIGNSNIITAKNATSANSCTHETLHLNLLRALIQGNCIKYP